MGRSGYEYSATCPEDLKTEFDEEYKVGFLFHRVTDDIQKIEEAITNNMNTITQLEAGISRAYLQADDESLSYSEQNQIRLSIESMTGQITDYENSIDALTPLLSTRQGQLQELKEFYGRE